jgi:iron complex outermembrane receptor protein
MGQALNANFRSPCFKLRKQTLLANLITLLLAHAALAHAGESDTIDLLEYESQVFAASRYAQAIEQTPANVTVLSRKEIKRFGYRNINEALASIPGLYNAASQWPALGVRGTAVPGDFGSRVLYLVNGMPMYEANYGSFLIEYLDIESIDRIEFIKGAGSALYGSGAVQAVVNLITRSGHEAVGNNIATEAGSHGMGKLYGSKGYHRDGLDSFVSASISRRGGHDIYLNEFDTPAFNSERFGGISRNNDSMRTTRLFGRVSNKDMWLQGMLIHADKDDPYASYNTAFNSRLGLEETLGSIEAGLNQELTNGARLTARAYYIDASEKGEYPYSRAPLNPRGQEADFINVSDLGSRELGMEIRHDQFLNNGHHLLTGMEIKRIEGHYEVGDQPGLERSGIVMTERRPDYNQLSLFAQDELRFGAGKLFLGARLDSYRGFSADVNSRVSPRIAYVHEFSSQTSGKLIYGEAYRAPTLYESQYQDGFPRAETIWANPTLRPELARSFEALIEHQPQAGTKWKLAAFLNRLTDTPVQVVVSELNGVACQFSCIQYQNSDTTQRVFGLEADVRYRFGHNDHAYASVVLQQSRLSGRELPASPKFQIKGGVSHALPWHNMNAALEAHYIDRAKGRIAPSGSRTATAPGYFLLNGAVNTGRLPGGWQLSLRTTNLLDRRIYTVASQELQPLERIPAAGREFSLQLQLEF